MRLFHVSEESDIQVFTPRLPKRKDLNPNIGLIWAIDEARLPNFLTPRNCPRVTYHTNAGTTAADRQRFFRLLRHFPRRCDRKRMVSHYEKHNAVPV